MAFGINPTQTMAGPVATGQSYAQQIAGGMPMEQIIAPGVSYSPEQSGGYTQKDLDFIAKGPAPVMPIAPTTGEVATIPNQMPYAPPGVTQPTPFNIGNTLFPNVDYLQGLDFSGLPALGNIDVDAIIKEYQDRQDAGEPEPFESFFTDFSSAPVMPQAPAYQEPVNFTAVPQAPVLAPIMPSIPGEPEPFFDITPELIAKQIEKQKIETAEPIYDRYIEPSAPMNFTGLPQMPFIPESIAFRPQPIPQPIPESITPMPVIPQMPVMPRIPQIAYIPPASSFIQPRVEEIVSPIRSGSPRNFQQPGLFNLA